VAFSEKSKSGRFLLKARYLYLDERAYWKKPEETAVLEPKLGGRIAGTVRLPKGMNPGRVGGTLNLEPDDSRRSTRGPEGRGTHDLSHGLAFAFDALPLDESGERLFSLSYDGEALVGSSGTLE